MFRSRVSRERLTGWSIMVDVGLRQVRVGSFPLNARWRKAENPLQGERSIES